MTLAEVNSSIVLALSDACLFRRISLIHCGSLTDCLNNTHCCLASQWPCRRSTYIVSRDCELCFGLNFKKLETCPIFCLCTLLENNRSCRSFYLHLFTYFLKNDLLLGGGERMPINQYLGESWTENDNPAVDATEMLLCLSNSLSLKATVYCISS